MSKKNKRVDQDVRPIGPWFSNYDYTGPEKATEISPGRGLYNGRMDAYKSVRDFIETKRKRRRELKNANFTADQLFKIATRFSNLTAQMPSTSNMDLTEMVSDIAAQFDPKAQLAVQNLANSGQLSAGTHITLNVDVNFVPVKKGNGYAAQATTTVTGSPENVRKAIQNVASSFNAAIANKLTGALSKIWAQEDEEKKKVPSAPGPRGGSFNFRQLTFDL